jgi:hypothetical protein
MDENGDHERREVSGASERVSGVWPIVAASAALWMGCEPPRRRGDGRVSGEASRPRKDKNKRRMARASRKRNRKRKKRRR